jgi:two-component system, OmpR family, sensor kinase
MRAPPGAGGAGFALRCDRTGVVAELLYQEDGAWPSLDPGSRLPDSVDPDSCEKMEAFLSEAGRKEEVAGWEINLQRAGSLIPLVFASVREGEGLVVAAATGSARLARLLDELAAGEGLTDPASARSLHRAAREIGARAEDEGGLFDELSRLNNELAVLQRELARKNAELEQLNALKNQFLGMAAHDLRSPLSALRMYAEFLQEASGSLDEEQRGFLATIVSSSEYMRGLVDSLLDVSVIESGDLSLDLRTTDLDALVDSVLASDHVLADRKGVRLLTRHSQASAMASLDPARIRQVISNLLGNAVKFTQPGGLVEIEVEARGSEVQVAVSDSGTGMQPERLATLFTGLAVKSARGTGGEKGTGLGLAISRRIVEGHGGRIEATSEPGLGTRVSFSLPASPV